MKYLVLYRGPLSSCNYGCEYCPFAKRDETYHQLADDRLALTRFVNWIAEQSTRQFGILFTPWGEALIRPWYQTAIAQLSQLPNVTKVAIQTNLSCDLEWVKNCRIERLALWTTFHPTEVKREQFLKRIQKLLDLGVRFSVGVVGLREHLSEIEHLRNELPAEVYLWVNAFKDREDYYRADEVTLLTAVDPLFPMNNQRHASLGEGCYAGETSFTVDGHGAIRRCHFVSDPITHLDDPAWEFALKPRACPNQTCSCHIGYVHLQKLNLYQTFGEGVLERIPGPSFNRSTSQMH